MSSSSPLLAAGFATKSVLVCSVTNLSLRLFSKKNFFKFIFVWVFVAAQAFLQLR